MKAAIIYWSAGGNTEKAALAIRKGLETSGTQVVFKKVEDGKDIDFFDYDLICIGFPSYQWHPPEPVDVFLKSKFSEYRQKGFVKTSSPRIPGKNALIFCTYSPALTRGLTKLFLRGNTPDNSSTIWVLMYWMNGISLANTMDQRSGIRRAGWETSRDGPTRRT